MPKLENEYGDHYKRPPDPMQNENQVIMSIGQGVLREIIDILLGSHKELVRHQINQQGLIHEVLDREKAMGLDVAFIKHGLTLENHGRPVTTLIDKEMDGMKLVRQEMEWEIQSDREMDWSNRHIENGVGNGRLRTRAGNGTL
ncbi:hypothetical protein Bca52824_026797 [Brassica carinata]|uniref:Uncharacterized protein n=1 Tax=Brassica carinata TaxID=52824 RepID=A0A8X7V955_BRACI|nr:hypothetical protein Bca52824_026797 [Brassica carinata]